MKAGLGSVFSLSMELEVLLLSALSSQRYRLSTYNMTGRATRSKTKAAAAATPVAPVQPAPVAGPRRRHTRANPIEENAVAPNATTNQTARRRAPAKSGTSRGKKSAKKNQSDSDEDAAPPEPAPAAADDVALVHERTPPPTQQERPRRRPPLATSPPPQDVNMLVDFGDELRQDAIVLDHDEDVGRLPLDLNDLPTFDDDFDFGGEGQDPPPEVEEPSDNEGPSAFPLHDGGDDADDEDDDIIVRDEASDAENDPHVALGGAGRTGMGLFGVVEETERRRALSPKKRPPGQVFDSQGRFVPSMHSRRPQPVPETSDAAHGQPEESGDDSGDDYFEGEQKKKARAQFYDHKTQSDEDAEEDEEFDAEGRASEEEEAEERKRKRKGQGKGKAKAKATKSGKKASKGTRKGAPKQTPSKEAKGKGKAVERLPSASEGEDYSSDDGADGAGGSSGKGPLPTALKDDIHELMNTLYADLAQVAHKHNRSERVVRSFALGKAALPRKKQLWNMFQQWRAQNGEPRGDATTQEWNAQLLEEYRERRNALPEDHDEADVEEAFSDVMSWHKELKERIINELILTKKMEKAIKPYVNSLNVISRNAYDDVDIQICGFIIDIHTGQSSMWGGTPEFAAWRANSQLAIHTQLADLAAIYRTYNMEKRAAASGQLDFVSHALRRRPNESPRDYARRLITECLRRDLVRAVDEPNAKPEWSPADMGFRYKVRIVNWPEELSAVTERPKTGWKPSATALDILLPQAKRKLGLIASPDNAATDDEDGASGGAGSDNDEASDEARTKQGRKKSKRVSDSELFRIESWSEGGFLRSLGNDILLTSDLISDDKELLEEDQGTVGVLVTTTGNVLVYVQDSTKYVKHLEKAQRDDREREKKATEKAEKAEKRNASKAVKKTTTTKVKRSNPAPAHEPRSHALPAAPPAAPVASSSRAPGPPGPAREERRPPATAIVGSSRSASPPLHVTVSPSPPPFAPKRPRSEFEPQQNPRLNTLPPHAPVASSSRLSPTIRPYRVEVEAWAGAPRTAGDGSTTRGPWRTGFIGFGEDAGHLEDEQEPPAKRQKLGRDARSPAPPVALIPAAPRSLRQAPPAREYHPSTNSTEFSMIFDARFYNNDGTLRQSAPAGFPGNIPTLSMSYEQRLADCWWNMPGQRSPGETRCRYQSRMKTSLQFSVVRFEPRAPDDDGEEDLAQYLVKYTPDGWSAVDRRLKAIVVNRHRHYHSDIMDAFREPDD
ncbi:hypothetical protein R3P38DRAFT_2792949 [Favolaschia claudopus]|uniref:Uncharacterized protein n=1 Tax=Favolaschia claudopus TaxID=2862362 RepID=A0AAW0AE14_9AGAR